MSPSPIDELRPSRAAERARPGPWARALRRAIGHRPRHTVYARPEGLQSWSSDARRNTGAAASAAEFVDFAAWCAANEGAEATLRVSGHLIHNLIVDPVMALADEDAVRRYARQQFAYYHGPQADEWPLASWLDRSGSGACALHALDLTALRAAAARHDVRLRGVAPAWSAGLASLSAANPSLAAAGRRALAVVEGTMLTWLVIENGRMTALQQRFLDAPRVPTLADLLVRLVAETPALAEEPFVVGWALEDADDGLLAHAQLLAPLGAHASAMRWMLDAMDAPP